MPKKPRDVNGPVPFDVQLRAARTLDKPFAETLYLQTMLPLLQALGLGSEERLRTRFAKAYRMSCSQIAQAEHTDVGWIQVSQSAGGLHLDQLHLVAQWRNKGIGSYLIERLIERARLASATIGLDVIRGNPALDLYRRFGFRTVSEDEEKFKMQWVADRTS